MEKLAIDLFVFTGLTKEKKYASILISISEQCIRVNKVDVTSQQVNHSISISVGL